MTFPEARMYIDKNVRVNWQGRAGDERVVIAEILAIRFVQKVGPCFIMDCGPIIAPTHVPLERVTEITTIPAGPWPAIFY